MKKTTASNPLKFFNDAKVARNKSFSKSLPKAQDGITMGPMTQQEAAQSAFASSQNNPMTSGEGPRVNSPAPKDVYKEKFANEQYNSAREKVRDTLRNTYNDAIQKDTNRWKKDSLNEYMRNNPITPKKKGGSVKSKKK